METGIGRRRNRPIRWAMLAFPLVFLIHDAEEVATRQRFLDENQAGLPLPAPLRARLDVINTRDFAVAVSLLSVGFAGVSAWAARELRAGPSLNAFATCVSILFLNVFTHAGQSLLLRRYTPGVVSAVTLSLPYSTLTLRLLLARGLLSRHDLVRALRRAALLGPPLAVGAQAIGKLLARS